MALIVQTGRKSTATSNERCARCGAGIPFGQVTMGAQVHLVGRSDYLWRQLHYPECPIKTKTWLRNNK